MKNHQNELRRDEILALARQARLIIVDGDACFLNDTATDKELMNFARMIQAHFAEQKQTA